VADVLGLSGPCSALAFGAYGPLRSTELPTRRANTLGKHSKNPALAGRRQKRKTPAEAGVRVAEGNPIKPWSVPYYSFILLFL
jgi:hypothetical protein